MVSIVSLNASSIILGTNCDINGEDSSNPGLVLISSKYISKLQSKIKSYPNISKVNFLPSLSLSLTDLKLSLMRSSILL